MGEKLEMSQYVWGENVRQVLDNSTTRLGLQKPAKFLFTIDGKLVRRSKHLMTDSDLSVQSVVHVLDADKGKR